MNNLVVIIYRCLTQGNQQHKANSQRLCYHCMLHWIPVDLQIERNLSKMQYTYIWELGQPANMMQLTTALVAQYLSNSWYLYVQQSVADENILTESLIARTDSVILNKSVIPIWPRSVIYMYKCIQKICHMCLTLVLKYSH